MKAAVIPSTSLNRRNIVLWSVGLKLRSRTLERLSKRQSHETATNGLWNIHREASWQSTRRVIAGQKTRGRKSSSLSCQRRCSCKNEKGTSKKSSKIWTKLPAASRNCPTTTPPIPASPSPTARSRAFRALMKSTLRRLLSTSRSATRRQRVTFPSYRRLRTKSAMCSARSTIATRRSTALVSGSRAHSTWKTPSLPTTQCATSLWTFGTRGCRQKLSKSLSRQWCSTAPRATPRAQHSSRLNPPRGLVHSRSCSPAASSTCSPRSPPKPATRKRKPAWASTHVAPDPRRSARHTPCGLGEWNAASSKSCSTWCLSPSSLVLISSFYSQKLTIEDTNRKIAIAKSPRCEEREIRAIAKWKLIEKYKQMILFNIKNNPQK